VKFNKVVARSPFDREKLVEIVAHPETLRQLEGDHLNAKIGEYLGILYGDQGKGLTLANHLFQGLERPFNHSVKDEGTYVYVLTPGSTYTYKDKSIGNVTALPAPKDSIFLAYVAIQGPGEDGSLLFWEWVIADADDPRLPRDSARRYRRKVWP
jgi:hypothetical protein